MPATINRTSTIEAEKFFSALKDQSQGASGTFDSAAPIDEIVKKLPSDTKVPKDLEIVLDEAANESSRVIKAIMDAAANYEKRHGEAPSADVLESAFRQAYSTTDHARKQFSLDSANSLQSDPLALQPNRAIVAIMNAITEAIPFAHYLPADIGSNEAKLAIMTHNAGQQYGGYEAGGSMDGVLSGRPFVTSSRVHTMVDNSGTWEGALTRVQLDQDHCDLNAGAMKLLRGRTLVYVAGQVVGQESSSSGTGASAIAGSITIGATKHVLGGSINTDTGVASLTFTPALPAGYSPVIEGFIDYERGEVAPELISQVETFTLHAKPWRVTTRLSIDARTQMANELGLDPYGESVLAIQTQFANERHYEVLAKALRLSVNNTGSFDFEWNDRKQAMSRNQIWPDLAGVIGAVSQQMAIDTLNHGISHIYVGKNIMAQLMSMPNTIFQPSGVSSKAGIFRIGRLFGQYEMYYTPHMLVESADGTSGQMLCIGRATDVTRNPFVLGDAVAPTVIPLAVNSDLRTGAGFYARNFTAVNPHEPSAKGVAMINVINMH